VVEVFINLGCTNSAKQGSYLAYNLLGGSVYVVAEHSVFADVAKTPLLAVSFFIVCRRHVVLLSSDQSILTGRLLLAVNCAANYAV